MTLGLGAQVAVVTGAGSGLGRAYARVLADYGAQVVVNDVGTDVHGRGQPSDSADAVVAEIREQGGRAVANYDSVATPEGGQAIITTALDTFGKVDAVVHNAGILRDRSFTRLSSEELDVVLDVHLRGAFHVVQPAFRYMKSTGHGRIVLTASATGLFGHFGQSNYGAAKMGLVGLANVLALEGHEHGIGVNVIVPSARTRMTEGLLGPLADALAPEHVAAMVAFLCSPDCHLTHEIFSVGGGRFARIFVGATRGWFHGPEVATPDEVAAHLDEIRALDDFAIPRSGQEEVALLLDALGHGRRRLGDSSRDP